MRYDIKRGNTVIANVTPAGKQSKKIMGENILSMSFDLPTNIDFEVNDYCEAFGEIYKLKELNDVKKTSSISFSYTLNLKGKAYDLQDANYMFPDANNEFTLSGQTMMGNLVTFIDLLILNANRDQTGWVKGVIDETDFQNITFNADETCLSALGSLATAFNTEWWVENQTIHMTKKGVVQDMPLKYGQGNGLYDIARTTATDKQLITRLYCYGSEKNIPANYKGFSNRLKLPGDLPYLEKNVYINDDPLQGIKYGPIEKTVYFDDIYPHRLGLITDVTDKFTFTDTGIDFNVNDTLLPGVTAHIIFNTGLLAGYTFAISSFDNATKTFKINSNQDDKAFILPTDTLKPAVGDQYVIVDVKMPTSYIEASELEVLDRGQTLLNVSSDAKANVDYAVTCDPLNFKQRNIQLVLGNYVPVSDDDLDFDENLRIAALTRDLQIISQYTLELTKNVVISSTLQNVVAAENTVKTVERIRKSTDLAYNNALQAKATADGVKLITDYWGVTIDPDHGIVASGTLLVGAGSENNAGITGVIDNIDSSDPLHPIDKSVRFWAGASYEDKETAPFRVLDTGQMYATAGMIGNYTIDNKGLRNTQNIDAYIDQTRTYPSGHIKRAAIGTAIDVSIFNYIGVFENTEGISGTPNGGVYISVKNGSSGGLQPAFTGNRALTIEGDFFIKDGNIVVEDTPGNYRNGITGTYEYERNGHGYEFKINNGIVTGQRLIS